MKDHYRITYLARESKEVGQGSYVLQEPFVWDGSRVCMWRGRKYREKTMAPGHKTPLQAKIPLNCILSTSVNTATAFWVSTGSKSSTCSNLRECEHTPQQWKETTDNMLPSSGRRGKENYFRADQNPINSKFSSLRSVCKNSNLYKHSIELKKNKYIWNISSIILEDI